MAPVKHKNRRPKVAPPTSSPGANSDASPPAVRAQAATAWPSAPSPVSAPLAPAGSLGLPSPTPSTAAAPLPTIDIADQLHSAAIHLLRRLRVRDRESGVGPAQLSALSVLVFGGLRSLGELADAEQVRPPTMSRIVAGLERSGLVRRHATEDGRRVQLEATSRGVALMWEGRQRRVSSLQKALDTLPERDREKLGAAISLLQNVIRNL